MKCPLGIWAFRQNFKVTKKDLDEFGYIPHCKRCDYMRTHESGQGCSEPQSHECRLRIFPELKKTQEGFGETGTGSPEARYR